MQFIRHFPSVYIQVAKMKTALTWLHISLMNPSDYCIQANPCLACAFVLCSDLRPKLKYPVITGGHNCRHIGNNDDLSAIQRMLI